MHRALGIQETLCDVFSYCTASVALCGIDEDGLATPELAALARTCRVFKEPALDLIWRALVDLSPLARCLPEASSRLPREPEYAFTRRLTQSEWEVLQRYTRRVRSIRNFNDGLDWESVKTFLNPPTATPLFPSLCKTSCLYTEKIIPLLHLPLPSLVLFSAYVQSPRSLWRSFTLLPKLFPNVATLRLSTRESDPAFSKRVSKCICRWQHLQTVILDTKITMDVDALVHLSRLPAFTRLNCFWNVTTQISDPSLVFSNLDDLTLRSKSWDSILRLFSSIRLPVVTALDVRIGERPSRVAFSSFLSCLLTLNSCHTLTSLHFDHELSNTDVRSDAIVLHPEGLRPCTAFNNLVDFSFDVKCIVSLTNNDLLELASAWPRLERFHINRNCGWNTPGGVTPDGLVELLRTCPSLCDVALCLDTRGYTEVPPNQAPADLGLTLPSNFSISILDSPIQSESVSAVGDFLCSFAACRTDEFSFVGYSWWTVADTPETRQYSALWADAKRRVDAAVRLNFKPRDSGSNSDLDLEAESGAPLTA